MNKDFHFIRLCELAAITSYPWIGKGDKNGLDNAAVTHMRQLLNKLEGNIQVVVGEGELDQAPMLYVGEKLGTKKGKFCFDLAVDPIEGTANAASNNGPSATVLAYGRKKSISKIPDMYMEKIFLRKCFANIVNLECGIKKVIQTLQEKFFRHKFSCIVMNKPRHVDIIKWFKKHNIAVTLINDGDVLASIAVAMNQIDFYYGIGGGPEGVLMAALALSTGCQFQGKFIKYSTIWPNDVISHKQSKFEENYLKKAGFDFDNVYNANHLIKDLKVRFICTFLTSWKKFQGITTAKNHKEYYVQTIFASHGILRKFDSNYDFTILEAIQSSWGLIKNK